MEEICISIPDELKNEAEELGLDLNVLMREFLIFKVFEKQLSESGELQKALFKSLVAKSKFTEKDADELSDKVKLSMHKDLKKRGLI